ncbi:MFS transporter [Streptomyces azureus]|uniref:Multidrug MFS transporter n=1 Tax=Streptomyces azureus TaxID=146537 RepID=A0A0K8PLW8_STRAJ|nr:MFS transporter [Streptomyces azureus]GAP48753.1 multidrug MFS transporter [Streptomyces azureus]
MSRLRGFGLLVAIILPSFMAALDNTIVNVAFPQIQEKLDLSESGLKWVATVYPLTFSSFLLLGGRCVDSRGRHPTLVLGIALFTASSLLCSMSTNGLDLTVWRGLQGVGAALVTPASLALLTQDLPPGARNAGISALTGALATALACGPVISGIITEHLGWNWLFAINAPLGVLSLLVTVAAIPRAAKPDGAVPWQPPHSALPLRTVMPACLFFGGFAYCLIEGPRYGFTAMRIVVPGIASLICVIAVVITASPTRRTPLADLLRRRAFAGGIVTQLLWGLGVTGVFFFTPQFLQNVLDFSPTSAGLTLTPVAAALLVTAVLVPKMARRWGEGRLSAVGLLLVALGLLLVARGSAAGGFTDLLPGLTGIGIGSAMAVPLTTRALESAPDHASGIAAGLFSATREASGVLGIAVVGVIVTYRQHSAASAGAHAGEAFLAGYQAGLYTAAALVAIGAPVALWTLRSPRARTAKMAGRFAAAEGRVHRRWVSALRTRMYGCEMSGWEAPSPSGARGFDVVRKGYARDQVDRYLAALSETDSAASPPLFQVVGRGYDCEQVDVRISELLADRDIRGHPDA